MILSVKLESSEGQTSDASTSSAKVRVHVEYKACQKNFSLQAGLYVFDGCQEFMGSADVGEGALICVACGCNREFHLMIVENEEDGIFVN